MTSSYHNDAYDDTDNDDDDDGTTYSSPSGQNTTPFNTIRNIESGNTLKKSTTSKAVGEHTHTSIGVPSPSRAWLLICACLLTSTLFQSIKPTDPYLPKYFQEGKAVSQHDVNQSIFPWRCYTYLFSLIPISILSEVITGYAPVIVVGLLCRLSTQFILYYGSGLLACQIGLAMFGASQSTKIIYNAYLYRMVPLHVFHTITGMLRAANLSAHVLGGLIGGVLHERAQTTNRSVWFELFTISQVSTTFGAFLFIMACVLSWRDRRLCAKHTITDSTVAPTIPIQVKLSPIDINSLSRSGLKQMCKTISDFVRCIYPTPVVLVWSVWWWVGFAIIEMMFDYQAVLWTATDIGDVKTGFVFSAARMCAASTALLSGTQRHLINTHGFIILAVASFTLGATLIISSTLTNIYISYALFVIFLGVHEFCFCAANAQVAICIDTKHRGVALLTNTLISMLLQSSIQILSGPSILNLSVRSKYFMFGCMLGALGLVMLTCANLLRNDSTIIPNHHQSHVIELSNVSRNIEKHSENEAGKNTMCSTTIMNV